MNPNNVTYLSAINNELHSLMESETGVILLGEDILDPYGGAFKVTKGLSSRFPGRVFTTPVSEAGLVGVSIGLAMRGFRPVVEIMFGDFIMLAADQIINHAAKIKWVYNDKVSAHVVIRTPMGGRRSYGPTHSQCLEKHFIGVPGLQIMAPHILGNPGKLLRHAVMGCDDPVLFIESKICYGKFLQAGVPDASIETYSDTGTPSPTTCLHWNCANPAPHGIIFCYGQMVPVCLEAIEHLKAKEKLYIDMVAPEQISPIPAAHIKKILDKYNPALCIYAEESNPVGGWSSEMIATIEEISGRQEGRSIIRHVRIGSKYSPVPSSRELEYQTLPQKEDIIQSVLKCF